MANIRTVYITNHSSKRDIDDDSDDVLIKCKFEDLMGSILTAFRMSPDRIVIDYDTWK